MAHRACVWLLLALACTSAEPRADSPAEPDSAPEPNSAPEQAPAPIVLESPPTVIALPLPPPAPVTVTVAPPLQAPPPSPATPRVGRVVEYHMASPGYHGGWEVDIIDCPTAQAEAIEAAITAFESAADPSDEDARLLLEPGTAAVPPSWDHGDVWTLVTRSGSMRRNVTGFSASTGAGELHFEVQLGKEKTPATRAVVAVRGTDLDPGLRLALPEPGDVTALGTDPIGAVRKAVLAGIDDAETRLPFERMRGKPSHLRVYPGRFPGGRTAVVVLDAPVRNSEELAPGARASAMLFVGPGGVLELFDVADVQGTIDLFGMFDGDGDGFDELFYEDAYYEGAYLHSATWKDGMPVLGILSGDGA